MHFFMILHILTLIIIKDVILYIDMLIMMSDAQSSLSRRQVPERIHLLGSESSDSMLRLALVMKVCPLSVV
jgi:hypothetical protein